MHFLPLILKLKLHAPSPIVLDTVTYGTEQSSFLSVRATDQLARDEVSTYRIGSFALLEDFYIDDLISGGNFLFAEVSAV